MKKLLLPSLFSRPSLLLASICLLAALPVRASLELKPAQAQGGRWQGGAFPDTVFEGVRYISTLFLENLFGREGSWVPDRQKYVVTDSAGRKWTFTLDNPYMNIGDEVFNLGFPVRRGPDLLYLPLPSLLRILNGRLGYGIALPPDSAPAAAVDIPARPGPAAPPKPSLARPEPGGFNILELTTEERENGTLVSVRTAGKLKVESYWVPPHFILKFERGLLAPQFPTRAAGQGLVRQVHSVQEKDLAQVTLNITRAIDTVEVAYAEDTPGYLVTVRKKDGKKARTEAAAAKNAASPVPPTAGKGTIIIDPGHGGKDQGAMVSGVNEAQVTLAVGLELKAQLIKLGYKALLTRETDEFISLEDRPKFASSKGGDLFVSLHCNSIAGSAKRKKAVSGHVAYILREGESEEDKALARRENQAISEESGKAGKGEISPVEWILLEHQLNLYSKESEAFAENVIREFEGFPIGKYGTGAGQAGFFVLVGAYMPAILFEMGFLTNDRDRRLMSSPKGQKQIAERLSQSIHKYLTGRATAREGRGKAGE